MFSVIIQPAFALSVATVPMHPKVFCNDRSLYRLPRKFWDIQRSAVHKMLSKRASFQVLTYKYETNDGNIMKGYLLPTPKCKDSNNLSAVKAWYDHVENRGDEAKKAIITNKENEEDVDWLLYVDEMDSFDAGNQNMTIYIYTPENNTEFWDEIEVTRRQIFRNRKKLYDKVDQLVKDIASEIINNNRKDTDGESGELGVERRELD
ncbi:hypothetical protein CMO94_01790 [Candidatus Woesearchaeota archaeon]|nr:hypothetical protein [Candidatus Woesearchaeota archaeon]